MPSVEDAPSSSVLVTSPLPRHEPVRHGYLKLGPGVNPPPVLSASPFVPRHMVEHLMRNKKPAAIGVKFTGITGRDAITNMEGALHTFLTPLVKIYMHGDYTYRGLHAVDEFPLNGKHQQARVVVLSAMIHPDFEGNTVMYKLAELHDDKEDGVDMGPSLPIPTVNEKQDRAVRDLYDSRLRSHMIYHLSEDRSLPARHSVSPMSYDEAVAFLSRGGSPRARYVKPNSHTKTVFSLELLFHSAVQQVVNEFSALESMCPNGYVYTFDPPAIFAQTLGATLLNRIWISALGHVSNLNPGGLRNMRVLGFNDYADREALPLIKHALTAHPHVSVVSKESLFHHGRYAPPAAAEHALLVIHNNSDAFGQNIETEGDGGSMDGAIGNHSSAAASLHRQHPNLLDHILDPGARLKAVEESGLLS